LIKHSFICINSLGAFVMPDFNQKTPQSLYVCNEHKNLMHFIKTQEKGPDDISFFKPDFYYKNTKKFEGGKFGLVKWKIGLGGGGGWKKQLFFLPYSMTGFL